MTNRKRPEISERLAESITSVEAHEQKVRREFQIDDYARKVQVPRESLQNNETVYRYMSVLRDAEAGADRLGVYSTIDAVIPRDDPVREKTRSASLLYATEQVILEDGFPEWDRTKGVDLESEATESITRHLTEAAKPYGLTVDVTEEWERRRIDEVDVFGMPYRPEGAPMQGMWTGAPMTLGQSEPWQRPGGGSTYWYWPDWPNERHDREHMADLAVEAKRQGMHPERPAVDPKAHTLLTALVYGRRMVTATENLAGLPPAPGMTPPATERLTRVAPLNRLAVAVLEDALRPGRLTREGFAAGLRPVVDAYGLVLRDRV
jgi:hypothetical protein